MTSDNIKIAATALGRSDAGVVLAHMFKGSQEDWFAFAGLLAAEGYVSLAFDFRGHGRTGGASDTVFLERDVQAAVAFLKQQ